MSGHQKQNALKEKSMSSKELMNSLKNQRSMKKNIVQYEDLVLKNQLLLHENWFALFIIVIFELHWKLSLL